MMVLLLAHPGVAEVHYKVLDTVTIHQSHYYGYFPSIQKLSTGELICDFSMDADHHDVEGAFWGYVISSDSGKTWGMRNTAGMIFRETSYTRVPRPDGSLWMVSGYPLAENGVDFKNLRTVSVRIFNGGKSILFERDVRITLPKPAARQKPDEEVKNFASLGPVKIKELAIALFNGDIIESRDGGLLTMMYGKFEGDRYFRSFVVRFDKQGKACKYVTTIAGDAEVVLLPGEEKTEGFTEPRMIRLRDSRLFVVMRRGSNNMMYRSWSEDDGKTWSKPESIGFRGVEPCLLLMSNGVLVLTTGRPEPVTAYFSEDGGSTWTGQVSLFKEKGTRYTGIVEVAPDRLLVVYDHVPFDWGVIPDSEPNAMNTIYGTFLEVRR